MVAGLLCLSDGQAALQDGVVGSHKGLLVVANCPVADSIQMYSFSLKLK